MKTRTLALVLSLGVGTLAAGAFAQAPPSTSLPAPGTPTADAPQSPEVLPDRRVTFRLKAAKAEKVTIAGEWTRPNAQPNTPEPMRKDAAGIWTITVGPLEPNVYIYVFDVDGMTIADPVNPQVKLRARASASMVEVPGDNPWEMRDVPHGTMSIETHVSKIVNGPRQVVVYTPAGYVGAASKTRYPVLYLLHGTNDLAVGWTMAGRANLIFDNLIADKRATPMIIVMPWGHALPFGAKPGPNEPTNNDLFERYLLEEVSPMIEGKYAVARGRANHAIAGLSMGGAQAMQIVLGHRDKFSALAVFGAGMNRADYEARFGDKMRGRPASEALSVVYFGIGKEDSGLPRARDLEARLAEQGLPVTYHEIDGGHTYPVWRALLSDAAPRFFVPTNKARSH